MERIILSKPIETTNGTVTEVNLDFDSLTGQDIIDAEKEFSIRGGNAIMKENSKMYQGIIAAKVSGIIYDDLLLCTAKDFSKITLQVQNFFYE